MTMQNSHKNNENHNNHSEVKQRNKYIVGITNENPNGTEGSPAGAEIEQRMALPRHWWKGYPSLGCRHREGPFTHLHQVEFH